VFQSAEIEKEFIARINNHQGILHKICFVYAHSKPETDDLYQEIILQLWKSYPSFKGKSAFSTWMYRVALNTAITQTQKASWISRSPYKKDAFYDLDKSMDHTEDLKTLYRAIGQLNKIEKAIILMWLEERPYPEIAEIIGITVKNVSVRLVRIKAKLTQIIERIQ
jgi:RNA polymerase sigma-70 factor (ECF subfamily)